MAGIYIHVPFCQSRCAYCDFYSTTLSEEWKSQYLYALEREMQARRQEVGNVQLDTLYLGGGTPSQLSPVMLRRLLDMVTGLFCLKADAEVTVEANPDDVTPLWLEALQHTPVN
ncbi:MAG: radical SAM protein, partial [Bacteroidaceae bacterium]|nr:radical SAM protein [Bacteroidaceae bacterium]